MQGQEQREMTSKFYCFGAIFLVVSGKKSFVATYGNYFILTASMGDECVMNKFSDFIDVYLVIVFI